MSHHDDSGRSTEARSAAPTTPSFDYDLVDAHPHAYGCALTQYYASMTTVWYKS